MIDAASVSIWVTDLVLLGLAYWVGRIHGSFILRDVYTAHLDRLLDEVKLMKKKVDRMGDIYMASRTEAKRTDGLRVDTQETGAVDMPDLR